MKLIQVESFGLRVSISNFLSCDHLTTFIPSGAPCHALCERSMKRVWVRSFRLRLPILNLLSFDHPSALFRFMQPIFHLLPLAYVLLVKPCEGAR